MNSNIKKSWGLILVTEFIMAQVIDGAWGILFVWLTFVCWEMWYWMVLEDVKAKAAEYHSNIVGRFKVSIAMIMAVETVFAVMSLVNIFASGVFSATVLGIAHSARFLAHSVLFIWQISMLMNAIAATMPLEQYTKERGKIILALIFAPIGVFVLPKEEKTENKEQGTGNKE